LLSFLRQLSYYYAVSFLRHFLHLFSLYCFSVISLRHEFLR
jgi:hypothetical protein